MGDKPDSGPITITDPGPGPTNDPPSTSTPSTGTTSGSSSSSSGSSSPPDPLAGLNAIQRQKYSMLSSTYASLWGEPPDPEYIKHAINEGLNVYEFSLQERMKPAFLTTKTFRDSAENWATLIKQMGVAG